MSLPRRWAGLLLAILVVLPVPPARAQDAGDPYAATVKVDATAENAVAARRKARLDGERQALQQVVDRLSGSGGARLPKLDDSAITNMVQSFEVAHERMSTVRYLADYTFHFYPDKVKRLLQNAGIAEVPPGTEPGTELGPAPGVAAAGKPTIVLPVYSDGGNPVLWGDPNPWRAAWTHRPAAAGSTRLLVPLGDVGDIATIDAQRAQSGNPGALAAIEQRDGAGAVVVAAATARRQQGRLAGLDVAIREYRAGQLADSANKAIEANPGEPAGAFLQRAADTIASALARGAVLTAAPGPAPQQSLDAVVPIASLAEWIETRRRLNSVMAIRNVVVLSLNRRQAEIEIDYVGNPDQLRAGLAGAELRLAGGDPIWRLEPAGATGLR